MTLGNDALPWDVAEEGSGSLLLLNDGAISVDAEAQPYRSYIWIPNRGDGTLSKVHTTTKVEEARYRLGPPSPFLVATGVDVGADGDVAVCGTDGLGGDRVLRIAASDCPAGETSTGGEDLLAWETDARAFRGG